MHLANATAGYLPLNLMVSRRAKLGASCRVKVPVGKSAEHTNWFRIYTLGNGSSSFQVELMILPIGEAIR
jgi:hypothetical protein